MCCSLVFRLLFRLAFQTALEAHFFALETEKPPKMEPKPSQNLAENASEIDLMLRTLKSESEQTLPHFCSFLLIPDTQKSQKKRTQMQTSLGQPLQAPKITIPDLFQLVFGSQLGPYLALSWLKSRLK